VGCWTAEKVPDNEKNLHLRVLEILGGFLFVLTCMSTLTTSASRVLKSSRLSSKRSSGRAPPRLDRLGFTGCATICAREVLFSTTGLGA
jgi:hypothetical protein